MTNFDQIEVKKFGEIDYLYSFSRMKSYTDRRTALSPDQIWLLQHPNVYTLGLAGKISHIINPLENIPIIRTNRGGQVTFHGPGQLIIYLLIDLKRRGLSVKEFVFFIEQAVIDCLEECGIAAERRCGAPGVYISNEQFSSGIKKGYAGAKIASIGLKISRGCSYHGLSLNVCMDLGPFRHINPCGFSDLRVVDMRMMGFSEGLERVEKILARRLQLGLNAKIY